MALPISCQCRTFTDGQDSFLFRISTNCGTCLRWNLQGSPRFLDNPLPHLPCSPTPVGLSSRTLVSGKEYCPHSNDCEGSGFVTSFEAQSHGFCVCCLRFALRSPYIRKTHFRLLVRLYRVGFAPTGLLKKFQRSWIFSQSTRLILAPRWPTALRHNTKNLYFS